MSTSDLEYLCEGSRHELEKIGRVLEAEGLEYAIRQKSDCRTAA